jgi:predicted methyltransferase
MKTLVASLLVFALVASAAADDLAKWAAAPHRSPANVARDGARHPVEALKFFGVQQKHTVVEILPGSTGYYLEILAPHLRDKGSLHRGEPRRNRRA